MKHETNSEIDKLREAERDFIDAFGQVTLSALLREKFGVGSIASLKPAQFENATATIRAAAADQILNGKSGASDADESEESEADEGTEGATTGETLAAMSGKIFGDRKHAAEAKANGGVAPEAKKDFGDAAKGETTQERLNSMAKAHYGADAK